MATYEQRLEAAVKSDVWADVQAVLDENQPYAISPIHIAARANATHVLSELMKKFDCTKPDRMGRNAFYEAVAEGALDAAKMLYATKKFELINPKNGNTVFHYASMGETTAEKGMYDWLLSLEGHPPLHAVNKKGENALYSAVSLGCLSTVKWLIAHGVKPAFKDHKAEESFTRLKPQKTLLHEAAENEGLEILKLIFTEYQKMGLSIDFQDTEDATALMVAAYRGQLENVRFLIEKGADIHAVGRCAFGEKGTPWQIAYENALMEDKEGIDETLQKWGARCRLVADYLKQVEEQQQAREDKRTVEELSRMQAELARLKSQDHHQKTQMTQMEEKMAQLELDARPRMVRQAQETALKSHPGLYQFFDKVSDKVIVLIRAYKILQTGLMDRAKDGLEKVAEKIPFVAKLIPLPWVDFVAEAVSKGVVMVHGFNMNRKIDAVSDLVSERVLRKEVDQAFRMISLFLLEHSPKVTKLTAESGKKLAECIFECVTEYFKETKALVADKPFMHHMVTAVGKHYASAKKPLATFETTTGEKVTDLDLFAGSAFVKAPEAVMAYTPVMKTSHASSYSTLLCSMPAAAARAASPAAAKASSASAVPASGSLFAGHAALMAQRALSPDRKKKESVGDGKERRATPPEGKEGKAATASALVT